MLRSTNFKFLKLRSKWVCESRAIVDTVLGPATCGGIGS
jgi:hypothetical protein